MTQFKKKRRHKWVLNWKAWLFRMAVLERRTGLHPGVSRRKVSDVFYMSLFRNADDSDKHWACPFDICFQSCFLSKWLFKIFKLLFKMFLTFNFIFLFFFNFYFYFVLLYNTLGDGILYNNLNEERIWKRIDMCICITDSRVCTPEPITTLLINCTRI